MDWIIASRGMDTLPPGSRRILHPAPLTENPGLAGKEAEEIRGLDSDAAASKAGHSITPDRLVPEA